MSALQIAEVIAVMLFSSAVTWKWLLMEKRKREDKIRNDVARFASQAVQREYTRYVSYCPCTSCGASGVDSVYLRVSCLGELVNQYVIRKCPACGRTTMVYI